MSHSTHVGFSAPLSDETTMDRFSCLPFAARRWIAGEERFPRSRSSPALGVGQNLCFPCFTAQDNGSPTLRWFLFSANSGVQLSEM
jgi:hypothetical protein